MLIRIVQSVLVGIGAGFLAAVLTLVGTHYYVSHHIRHEPGVGMVFGGIAPSLVVMALVFCLGFLWNLLLTRNVR